MSKKLITFTDKMEEMIKEIQDMKGLPSFTSAVHASVSDTHAKLFPSYNRPLRQDEAPVDKIKRRSEEKKAKEDIARDEYLEIANLLGGEIVNEAGKEFCVYFNYTGTKRFEQKVPLQMLSSDLVKIQYQPSREKVEQLQKEGKTDY